MCTVSYRRSHESLDLLFSRDEQRSRVKATAPGLHERAGSRFLAPIDPQGGGTWIHVNEHGLVAAVLNRYDIPPCAPPTHSRGLLMLATTQAHGVSDFGQLVESALKAGVYAACTLLALDRESVGIWCWSGEELRPEAPPQSPVLTSSSWNTESVCEARRLAFARHVAQPAQPTLAEMERFHRHRDPRGDGFSVLMARPDARTVSLTQVKIENGTASMRYAARRPDDAGFEPFVETSLPLHA